MRFTLTRKVLKRDLEWVVVDTESNEVVSTGSHEACSKALDELNAGQPRMTQKQIDGVGAHRQGFTYGLTQLRTAIHGRAH